MRKQNLIAANSINFQHRGLSSGSILRLHLPFVFCFGFRLSLTLAQARGNWLLLWLWLFLLLWIWTWILLWSACRHLPIASRKAQAVSRKSRHRIKTSHGALMARIKQKLGSLLSADCDFVNDHTVPIASLAQTKQAEISLETTHKTTDKNNKTRQNKSKTTESH